MEKDLPRDLVLVLIPLVPSVTQRKSLWTSYILSEHQRKFPPYLRSLFHFSSEPKVAQSKLGWPQKRLGPITIANIP